MSRRGVTPALTGISAGILAATVGCTPLAQAAPNERPGVDRTFSGATLNILGSNHTKGRDLRRTKRTARLIRRQHLKLFGLQEVQADQLRGLRRRLPHYRFWPARTLGPGGLRLQIAWRPGRFDLVDHGTITTRFSHQRRPVPWVRLLDEATGHRIFVINVHNSPGRQERDRDSATRKEIRLFKRLRDRGPTMILGDANERREWFCRLAKRAHVRAANGGSYSVRDGCSPPDRMYVDWLMVGGTIDWRRYRAVDVAVSDHRLHRAVLRWGRL